VFSLGAVLVFAAAGEGPFGTGSTAALVYRVVHSPPNLQQVPAEVRPMAERCLAKEPSRRPATGELLAGLPGADLAAGWLPTAITEGFSRSAGTSHPGSADRPATKPAFVPGGPAPDLPTVTAAKRFQVPGAPTGDPRPDTVAGGSPRRRRRPAALAVLLAGVLVVASAGTVLALHRSTGRAASSQPPSTTGVPPATATGQPSASHPGPPAPTAPTHVVATASGPYTIRVSWADKNASITGFNIGNGCGTSGCSGGAINIRTGPVTAANITTTPGAYQCFYVQAVNSSGTSAWAGPGCISTPGINIPVNQKWTYTGVTVRSGAAIGITATGDAYLAAATSSQTPSGNPSCTPATSYAADSSGFPAPDLPCWSLIARIGNGQPFEVGTSILVTATTGRLYLGVNDDSVTGNTGIWPVKIKIGGLP
jgi:hypothetical protein